MIVRLVEVEFVGGPLDGHEQVVPGDEREQPPPCLLYETFDPLPLSKPVEEWGPITSKVHHYHARVSPRDDGPIWQMTYEGVLAR